MKKHVRAQAGTTLLEVMVSVVVLAIGLLGVASLQVNSLKYQKTANQRIEATQAAYDIAERMRANWVFTTANSGTAVSADALYIADRKLNEDKYQLVATYAANLAAADSAVPNDCTVVTGCDTNKIAKNDLQDWLRKLKQKLINGTGIISGVVGATSSSFDVTVMWQEQGFDAKDSTCPVATSAPAGIRCFTVRVTV